MDVFLQWLLEWGADRIDERYGRAAAWMATIVGILVVVGGLVAILVYTLG